MMPLYLRILIEPWCVMMLPQIWVDIFHPAEHHTIIVPKLVTWQWISAANLITPRSFFFYWCSIIQSDGIQWHPVASNSVRDKVSKLGLAKVQGKTSSWDIRVSDGCCKWVPFYSEIVPWIKDPRISLRTCGSTFASLYPYIPYILIHLNTLYMYIYPSFSSAP